MKFPTQIVSPASITSLPAPAEFRNTRVDLPGIAATTPDFRVAGVLAQTRNPARRDQ
jgi:hypothetical protein